MLTKEQIAVLLNRSLTTAEDENFDTYLDIATQKLEDLLCLTICCDEDAHTYDTRYGYRTVYVNPFTELTSVEVDGNEVDEDDYTVKQNDKYNGSWYNIIEFDSKQTGKKIVVTADWGFGSLPADLQLLLAQLFNQNSIDQTADNSVKSKKIEDFSVTYKDSATFDEFVTANSSIIDKYAQCNQGAIRHGDVRTWVSDYESIRPLY